MAYSPPPGIVEEFKVVGSMFDASYGYFAGATINLSLEVRHELTPRPSSTTSYQTPAWEPICFSTTPRARPRRLCGWSAGAPPPAVRFYIPKVVNGRNKLFFMFGYEGLKSFDPTPFGVLGRAHRRRKGRQFFRACWRWGPTTTLRPLQLRCNRNRAVQQNSRCPATSCRQARSIRRQPPSPSCGTSRTWPAHARGLSNYTMGMNSQATLTTIISAGSTITRRTKRGCISGRITPPIPGRRITGINGAEGWTVTRGNTGGVVDSVYTVSPDLLYRRPLQLQPVQVDLRPGRYGIDLAGMGFSRTLHQSNQGGEPGAVSACRQL